ncbi:hypothetical protein [Streptomyces sp. NPDC020362]|uniref:hypothetical protein n=1 Tax=unclassified Streptomyces TaxID=2593676 RepID=UPI0033F66461
MSASPAVRSLRGAVFAAVCVLLAAAGHGLAMGDMPPLWADAVAFLAVFALGCTLGGRERSLPGIGAAMLLTQAGLHIAFDAAHQSTAGGSAHMLRMASMPGHTMAMTQAHAQPVHTHPTACATAAHVLAALVASWWLRRGEAALWSLLRRAAALVPAGLLAWWRGTRPPAPAGPALRVPDGPEPPRRPALRHAVSRRGPPAPIPYPV